MTTKTGKALSKDFTAKLPWYARRKVEKQLEQAEAELRQETVGV